MSDSVSNNNSTNVNNNNNNHNNNNDSNRHNNNNNNANFEHGNANNNGDDNTDSETEITFNTDDRRRLPLTLVHKRVCINDERARVKLHYADKDKQIVEFLNGPDQGSLLNIVKDINFI